MSEGHDMRLSIHCPHCGRKPGKKDVFGQSKTQETIHRRLILLYFWWFAGRQSLDRLGPSGGSGEIRTHGRFPVAGFQDRCNRPLCHASLVDGCGFYPFRAGSSGKKRPWRSLRKSMPCTVGLACTQSRSSSPCRSAVSSARAMLVMASPVRSL